MAITRKSGYGVLASDLHRDVVASFSRDIETRMCIPSPNGDGSVLTLVTRLNAVGTYEVIIEDSHRNARRSFIGNIYTDTMEGYSGKNQTEDR